ncbi:hypothetical protein L2E67_04315 [Planktothrix agardhii 1803]|uniref:hypothetical protein n=1 Tax=Planktothrix agardhii TaxID=1160 RepID=UPI001F39614A|nr:hypothetical protein [Planktothrix agardhii]MCF3572594.1 hypothetical protein [Planktothrix agardhii 1805]MCF3584317.1 hypothetical protein [Planktothrix agardhii 1803]CAD5925438.1 hypothetical protein NO2A_01379 [Planktothrix agardhii]
MNDDLLLLEKVAQFVLTGKGEKPNSSLIAETLIRCENQAKKTKEKHSFESLVGNWRLCWVSGTQKIRKQAGIVKGNGLYIPSFLNLQIIYSRYPHPLLTIEVPTEIDAGIIQNCVQLNQFNLTLTGPAKFLEKKNILAFDFTNLTSKLFGLNIYDGKMHGTSSNAQQFYQDSIKKQAFFAFFVITPDLIAARGRGGGLALWTKV